ncbi:hypothetical protein M3I54_41535, partial [Paraburkholderia sp. CNPSo 3274]
AAPDNAPKNIIRPPPHQAPTLIGCKFLKIDREVAAQFRSDNHLTTGFFLRCCVCSRETRL